VSDRGEDSGPIAPAGAPRKAFGLDVLVRNPVSVGEAESLGGLDVNEAGNSSRTKRGGIPKMAG